MNFPRLVSFTITNACNLRCRMCGQWSEHGYIRTGAVPRSAMRLAEWMRLVDEMADNGVSWLLVRGGEPFLFPGIIELLGYAASKGIALSIDTNGTMLAKYAAELIQIGKLHLTVSVDGPESVHDSVRGIPGAFKRTQDGLRALRELELSTGTTISRSICFTISPYSVGGLGEMPEVARRLEIPVISIVPYYYFPESVGKAYEEELASFGTAPYSWHGFEHETSGIDFDEFRAQLHRFETTLDPTHNYPFLSLTEGEYRTWFADAVSPVGPTTCWSIDELVDIQPGGDANFCVDFPDWTIGNVKHSTISEVWNGERAERFRALRREKPLSVCRRCGAKYMAAPRDPATNEVVR